MIPKPFVVGLGGSLRGASISRLALKNSLALVEEMGAETALFDVQALNLPMYIPDWQIEDYPVHYQQTIDEFIEATRRADAMLWVSPTYHGTVSGAFKNALDFLDLLRNDARPYLTGRAVGLIAVSDQQTFGAMMTAAHELRAWLAPTQVIVADEDFDVHGILQGERTLRRLKRLGLELYEFSSQRVQLAIER